MSKEETTANAENSKSGIMNIHEKLMLVQTQLRVGKNRGKGHTPGAAVTYEYRNAEDILEAVKPVCAKYRAYVKVDVTPIVIGLQIPVAPIETPNGKDSSRPRIAAQAVASLVCCDTGLSISATDFAYVGDPRKGQTEPEKLCGSASSYASKYALSHLFALDNNKDADMESDEAKPAPSLAKFATQPVNPKVCPSGISKKLTGVAWSDPRWKTETLKGVAALDAQQYPQLTPEHRNAIINELSIREGDF